MSLSSLAPTRALRLAAALLAAALLSLGAVATTPSPAGAVYIGHLSAVPVGAWGGAWGNSAYRIKLGTGPWGPSGSFFTDRAIAEECDEYSTLDDVSWVVAYPGVPELGVHVLGVNRYFACEGMTFY